MPTAPPARGLVSFRHGGEVPPARLQRHGALIATNERTPVLLELRRHDIDQPVDDRDRLRRIAERQGMFGAKRLVSVNLSSLR